MLPSICASAQSASLQVAKCLPFQTLPSDTALPLHGVPKCGVRPNVPAAIQMKSHFLISNGFSPGVDVSRKEKTVKATSFRRADFLSGEGMSLLKLDVTRPFSAHTIVCKPGVTCQVAAGTAVPEESLPSIHRFTTNLKCRFRRTVLPVVVSSSVTVGWSYGAIGTRRDSKHWLRNSPVGNRSVEAQAVRVIKGDILKGKGLRIAVVAARFNDIVTKPLLAGALETFQNYGVRDEDIDVFWVPGSFEIPVTAQALAKSKKYDSVLTLGAVIRGATTHYDAVANGAASGLLSASLNSGCPCIFGVLTTENMEQAFDRAGGKAGNKGSECALTAIEMASLFKHQISEVTRRI